MENYIVSSQLSGPCSSGLSTLNENSSFEFQTGMFSTPTLRYQGLKPGPFACKIDALPLSNNAIRHVKRKKDWW